MSAILGMFGAACAAFVVYCIVNGRVYAKNADPPWVERDERPATYWTVIGCYTFTACLMLAAAWFRRNG